MPDDETTAPFETETLQAAWASREVRYPRCFAYIQFGAKTDLGRVRENNEDKFDFLEPEDPTALALRGRVFAVADGMGGHSAGQVASELALNVFIRSYYADTGENLEASLVGAVQAANKYINDLARSNQGRSGMGATLTAAVVLDDDLYVVQVGDSRCYLLRDGRLEQITDDHSYVAEQVRAGAMTEEDAERSPFRNIITRSMGGAAVVEPDVTAVKLRVGDRLLLCSDGLSGMVSDAGIAELLPMGSPTVAVWNLIDSANRQGGRDNITAMVLHIADIQEWPRPIDDDPAMATAAVDLPMELPAREAEAVPAAGAASGSLLGKLFNR